MTNYHVAIIAKHVRQFERSPILFSVPDDIDAAFQDEIEAMFGA